MLPDFLVERRPLTIHFLFCFIISKPRRVLIPPLACRLGRWFYWGVVLISEALRGVALVFSFIHFGVFTSKLSFVSFYKVARRYKEDGWEICLAQMQKKREAMHFSDFYIMGLEGNL